MALLEQQINLIELTKKEKLVADYLLKNIETACFESSNEIAKRLNIGASSVVRLSKKLGFENYSALRRELQSEANGSALKGIISAPYEKLDDYGHLSDMELLNTYTQNIMEHIRTDSKKGTECKLIEAADAILKAKRVFVVGHRACAGFASSFVTMLACCRPDVFVAGNRPLVDQLIDLTPDDLLIAVSFSRYSKDTIFAVKMASDSGCKIISLTDHYTAPIAGYSDIVIINNVDNFSFFNTYTSCVMNMEKIVLLISHRSKEKTQNRLKEMERYLEITNQY